MTHIKNTSFGYTSTLLRLFHRVDIHLSEDTVINVYPHEDDPDDKHVGRFDVEVSRDDGVHRTYPNLSYPEVISKLEAYYDIA